MVYCVYTVQIPSVPIFMGAFPSYGEAFRFLLGRRKAGFTLDLAIRL